MKPITPKLISLITILIFFINYITVAQVGVGTTSPDASSMLDVQSTTKRNADSQDGLLLKEGITSPATGLLVFDTDTQSFWFYSGTWTELSDGNQMK